MGYIKIQRFKGYNAKFNHLNFHPFEVVSRYRDPQLQVGENYSYFETKHVHILLFKHIFHSQYQCFHWLIKLIQNSYNRD